MKKKALKRILWIAGLAFVLLLTLAVFPGLQYEWNGPWGTHVAKSETAEGNSFVMQIQDLKFGYSPTLKSDSESWWWPEGYSSTDDSIRFRYGGLYIWLDRNHYAETK